MRARSDKISVLIRRAIRELALSLAFSLPTITQRRGPGSSQHEGTVCLGTKKGGFKMAPALLEP